MEAQAQTRLNLKEIAKLAGTSKSTVSRVLRNQPRVSPETRARVQHIIEARNYQPNLFARGLTGARTGLIGVLGRWLESGFAAEVIRGINDEADKHGGRLLCSFAPGIDEYITLWKNFIEGGAVDGVILVAPPVDIYAREFKRNGKPTVLCASHPPAEGANGWADAGYVALGNERAMRTVLEHLVDRGYRNLVHMAGSPDIVDSRERCDAFTTIVAEHKGVKGTIVQGAWTQELARSVTLEYLQTHRRRPDAFVAFNDAVAIGVVEALNEQGIFVPEEVAVTGWDDIPFSTFAGLTTIHLPMTEVGKEAARILFEDMGGIRNIWHKRQVTLDMPLEVRRTTTGPK